MNNAGLLKRSFANIVDTMLLGVVLGLPMVLFSMNADFDKLPGIIVYTISAVMLMGIVTVLYHSFLVSSFGATLGKMLFGLKIVDQNTGNNVDFRTAFLRTTVGYGFSAQFFGLGFMRIAKHPEKLGWHDELFDTRVEVRGSSALGLIGFFVLLIALGYMTYLITSNLMGALESGSMMEQMIPTPDQGFNNDMFL